MKKIKKAALSVGALKAAGEMEKRRSFLFPSHFTRRGSDFQMISEQLKNGRENATSAAELADNLHISTRKLRSQIMQERESGVLILYAPGKGGYFLPSENPECAQQELSAFYSAQAARCKHGLKALTPVARALKIPTGQLEFDGE